MDSQRTLLIVDDEINIINALSRVLHQESYRLLTTTSCETAFDILEKESVAVVISDLRMPEMPGDKFLEQVKEKYPETVRLLLSGYVDFSAVTNALNHGAISKFLAKPWDNEDIKKQIQEAFAQYEKRAIFTHQHLNSHDTLTCLPNRTSFYQHLDMAIENTEQENSSLGILFINIDRFKKINESIGMAKGDEILQKISERLSQTIGDQFFIARLDGVTFGVIAPNHSKEKLKPLAALLTQTLKKPFNIAGTDLYLTHNIGISIFPEHGYSGQFLMKNAAEAMFQSKNNGCNQYCVYEPLENADSTPFHQLRLETDLHRAVENKEFIICYQPQLDIQTQKIIGFEALLQWKHPEQGLLLPDSFIDQLEETGLMVTLSDWIINEALSQLSQWHQQGFNHLSMGINLSPSLLKQDHLPEKLKKRIEEYDLPQKLITLEITEYGLIQSRSKNTKILQSISKDGCLLALDNFGEDSSSLIYSHELPFKIFKIDRNFTRKMSKGNQEHMIIQDMISMAKKLNQFIIAEGVETEEQLELLKAMDCDGMQGFLYKKPLSNEEASKLLMEKGEGGAQHE